MLVPRYFLLVASNFLLVDRYFLFVACYFLLVARWFLFVTCHFLLLGVTFCVFLAFFIQDILLCFTVPICELIRLSGERNAFSEAKVKLGVKNKYAR